MAFFTQAINEKFQCIPEKIGTADKTSCVCSSRVYTVLKAVEILASILAIAVVVVNLLHALPIPPAANYAALGVLGFMAIQYGIVKNIVEFCKDKQTPNPST